MGRRGQVLYPTLERYLIHPRLLARRNVGVTDSPRSYGVLLFGIREKG